MKRPPAAAATGDGQTAEEVDGPPLAVPAPTARTEDLVASSVASLNGDGAGVARPALVGVSRLGEPVTLTARITGDAPGTPTGTVFFIVGKRTLGSAGLGPDGEASLVTTALDVGRHLVTVTYHGDARFAPSTTCFERVVERAATTTRAELQPGVGGPGPASGCVSGPGTRAATSVHLSAHPERSRWGEPVSYTVTVRSSAPGTPTGAVRLWAGEILLGEDLLDAGGSVRVEGPSLPVGHHVVVAVYEGDVHFSAGSAPLEHDIVRAPTAVEITGGGPVPVERSATEE
ncbi:MAG: Ig-like domain-containing protein [Acidimicrobiia bacterium]